MRFKFFLKRYWKRRGKDEIKALDIQTCEKDIDCHSKRESDKSSFCFIAISKPYPKEQLSLMKEFADSMDDKFIDISGLRIETTQDRLKIALTYLNSVKAQQNKCAIKNGSDYALIFKAIKAGIFRGYEHVLNYSTPKFVKYVRELGFSNIVQSKTIDKRYNTIIIHGNDKLIWDYTDCYDNVLEKNRRNKIVRAFVDIMNEI